MPNRSTAPIRTITARIHSSGAIISSLSLVDSVRAAESGPVRTGMSMRASVRSRFPILPRLHRPIRRTLPLALATAAVALVVLAACGGGGELELVLPAAR